MNFGKVGAYDMMQGIGMINFLEWREINSFLFVFSSLFLFWLDTGTVIWLERLLEYCRARTQIFAMRDVLLYMRVELDRNSAVEYWYFARGMCNFKL